MGEPEKSLEFYEKVVEINPYESTFFYRKGRVHDKLKQYQKCIECFSKAIELNPSNPESYLELGNTYLTLGFESDHASHYEKAIENYDKIIKELAPRREKTHFNRGTAKYFLKDYEGAKEDMLQSLEIDVNDPELQGHAYFKLGDCHYNLSFKEQACEAWKAGVALGNQPCQNRLDKYCKKKWRLFRRK